MPERRYGFAAEHTDQELLLFVDLPTGAAGSPPNLSWQSSAPGCALSVVGESQPGTWRLRLSIPPAPAPAQDDEVTFQITAADRNRLAKVLLRRTNCRISTTLLGRPGQANPLWAQTRAALLWFGWKRFQELCGLKRFTSGKSGSDVLVFRPRLCDPDLSGTPLRQGEMAGVIREAWGSCLLAKTGQKERIEEEWQRFERFLADRLHPFMARSEVFLTTQPAWEPASDAPQGTVIGSFLGGDLLQVESFEALVRSASDSQPCLGVLEKLFAIAATWYSGSAIQPLGAWFKMFRRSASEAFLPAGQYSLVRKSAPGDWYDVPLPPPDVPLAMFGRFDLTREEDRRKYYRGVAWDTSFITKDHLVTHLLGKDREGLLYRLMTLPVRFSLTHGDLHTRNLLVDREDVLFIDFGETGVAPTLFDFAKLEIYLRLWCLNMSPRARDLDDAAMRFETQLLDYMTGSEGSLAPVQELACEFGSEATELLKIAQCICRIRRRAAAYTLGTPDRRDYLAVLYLTVLNTLQFAGNDTALTENYRLLLGLCWVLEDALSRVVGLEPYPRQRAAFEPRFLLRPDWLRAPGAPGRIRYYLDRPDGKLALAPLDATRGVLQNQAHHLDVFDHTLLVLAYVEELIASSDPLAGLLDPSALDQRVEQNLRQQQLVLPPPAPARDPLRPEIAAFEELLEPVRQMLRVCLDEESCVLLKWAVVFHDVGKPATRSVNLKGTNKVQEKRVQFLGHEIYSLHLAADHLAYLFPDPDCQVDRDRVSQLILRHLDPLQLMNRYLQEIPEVYPEVKAAAATGRIPARELNFLKRYWDEQGDKYTHDFPLLLLHGFADTLATRGSDPKRPYGQVAEVILVLLRLYVWYDEIRKTEAQQKRFKDLSKNFNTELGVDGPALGKKLRRLEQWYLAETALREAAGEADVTRAELLVRAREHDDNGLE